MKGPTAKPLILQYPRQVLPVLAEVWQWRAETVGGTAPETVGRTSGRYDLLCVPKCSFDLMQGWFAKGELGFTVSTVSIRLPSSVGTREVLKV